MLPATQTDTVVCNEARGVAVNHDIALPCTDDRRRSAWQRLLGLAAVLLLPISLAAAPPQRIVSMNVCTDQLLLDLDQAPRELIGPCFARYESLFGLGVA